MSDAHLPFLFNFNKGSHFHDHVHDKDILHLPNYSTEPRALSTNHCSSPPSLMCLYPAIATCKTRWLERHEMHTFNAWPDCMMNVSSLQLNLHVSLILDITRLILQPPRPLKKTTCIQPTFNMQSSASLLHDLAIGIYLACPLSIMYMWHKYDYTKVQTTTVDAVLLKRPSPVPRQENVATAKGTSKTWLAVRCQATNYFPNPQHKSNASQNTLRGAASRNAILCVASLQKNLSLRSIHA